MLSMACLNGLYDHEVKGAVLTLEDVHKKLMPEVLSLIEQLI